MRRRGKAARSRNVLGWNKGKTSNEEYTTAGLPKRRNELRELLFGGDGLERADVRRIPGRNVRSSGGNRPWHLQQCVLTRGTHGLIGKLPDQQVEHQTQHAEYDSEKQ